MNANERKRTIETRRADTLTKAKLWCKDEWKQFPIYRVPVEALMLHVDNHRFQAERKLFESKLKRALDPENTLVDQESIIAILLDNGLEVEGDKIIGKPTKDAEALRSDWTARGQETPFWIRPDGTVRNGNRRLAMVLRLRAEKGVEGLAFVEAVILDPNEVNERDLFEMEQREQLTENLKIRYTDINLLLTLKAAAEACKIDWNDAESIDDTAALLQHVAKSNKAYAAIQLRAIKYMDLFLKDAGKEGQYQDLLRQVERFREIGKLMVSMEEDYPDEAPDMLRLAFAAIRAANKHGDIRQFRKIFVEDRARYKKLLAWITKDEEEWEKAGEGTRLAEPKIVTKPSDDEEDEDDIPGPVVPNYPADRVKARITNTIDGYKAMHLNVAQILETSYDRLQSIDVKKLRDAIEDDDGMDVAETLTKLVTWVDTAKSALPRGSPSKAGPTTNKLTKVTPPTAKKKSK